MQFKPEQRRALESQILQPHLPIEHCKLLAAVLADARIEARPSLHVQIPNRCPAACASWKC
jgi:hypothetical protein